MDAEIEVVDGIEVLKAANLLVHERMWRHDKMEEQHLYSSFYISGYWLAYEEVGLNMQPIIPPGGVTIEKPDEVPEREWHWMQGYMDGWQYGEARYHWRERLSAIKSCYAEPVASGWDIEKELVAQRIREGLDVENSTIKEW